MHVEENMNKASDADDAIIQVGMDSRILEHLGSEAEVEELNDEEEVV